MISYLIPSYNHAQFLPALLQNISLDIQSLTIAAEVIIIDDGSSDNSAALIKAWTEQEASKFKISCFYQKNRGLTATLNQLISRAEGSYLRLCASDDIVLPGSSQRLYEQFLSNPQLVCVLADARVIDEQERVLDESSIAFHGGRVQSLLNPASLTKELIQHWCVAGPSHLIKKSHYERMLYNESSKIDDYDLFLSLLESPGKLTFINEKACLYRVHKTNTSKSKNRKKRIENIGSFLDIINKYLDRPILAKYLTSVKYLSKAKIYYLQRQYFRCLFSMGISMFFKIKSELKF
ncbi:Chondroitin polymerase [Legionella massiliensis]|uniref:Chondroitin polymerase n=1 Tax=Legionella massiliensis TaxID=1034943 RepID=A0A078L0N6_9GAMM|nr:glycosyltransferase family 2 protein [Legionella massiliensis]CDZ78812.1 Chondroitin polymerase [Legionella massiliensis]CEE14550.1 Chondroitin synthase [Legionella massiliensis]